MNKRKKIINLLLVVLGLVVIYNFLIAPILMQYNNRMGMGMHGRMHGDYYTTDSRYAVLIVFVIAVFAIFELLRPKPKANNCLKCGCKIESDRWKVCPECGSQIKNKG
ncbi:MAG: hypothetical protein N3B21_09740 [Clostridia bacterium]|nr:hypothetical protein [Clostridia bacterium]